jgi:glucose-6-phosphate isomerase
MEWFLIDYSKNIINQETIDPYWIGKWSRFKKRLFQIILKERSLIKQKTERSYCFKSKRISGYKCKSKCRSWNLWCKEKIFFEWNNSGERTGYTGKPTYCNIGIGGSDLGPAMVVEALQFYKISWMFILSQI